jgi:NADPH:quinone reductase-like Zn-dependent oxidoreductase
MRHRDADFAVAHLQRCHLQHRRHIGDTFARGCFTVVDRTEEMRHYMSENSVILPLVSKAVTYLGLGGHEVIKLLERTVRAPGAGEVRIAVKAAAVNPTDILSRTPGYGDPTSQVVPGMDAAGVIEAVGPGVSRLHVGQLVMAAVSPRRPDGGAQSQYIVVPAASVVPIPDGVSVAEASTLPMNGLTALGALSLASLKKGQTFAVSGGAGLLAHYAIAAAKRQGLKVIADAKPEEADLVRSYGADVVIERGPGYADAIRREMPEGVDALLDTALLAEKSFGAIRDGGLYIPVRGWNDKPSERGIVIKPIFVDTVLERTDWLEVLRDMVAASEIKLRVTGEYTPDQTADAQRAVEAGGLRGRPVIVF